MSEHRCRSCGRYYDDRSYNYSDGYHDYHHHSHCCCNHHYRESHSCHCHHHDLCSNHFHLRLGGLRGGLGFRLRQLIGEKVEFELEDGKKIDANIMYVGSNYVEVKVKDSEETVDALPNDDQEPDEQYMESSDSRNDEEQMESPNKDHSSHHSHHRHLIFSFDKVKYVEFDHHDDYHDRY